MLALTLALSTFGCTGITPQLHPTDIEALEQIEDREAREQAYAENEIVRVSDARGLRYTKGRRLGARPRSWQSLDLILRSDRNSAAALPEKKLRAARVLTGFLVASAIVTVGGIASSAREGLDLSRPTGTSGALIGGALGMLGFGIATGVVWGQAKKGYEGAIDVYNDSLALRLGISDAEGNYRAPEGVLIDEEGFIILDQRELSAPELRPKPPPPVQPQPETGAPETGTPEAGAPETGAPETTAPEGEPTPPPPSDDDDDDTDTETDTEHGAEPVGPTIGLVGPSRP